MSNKKALFIIVSQFGHIGLNGLDIAKLAPDGTVAGECVVDFA